MHIPSSKYFYKDWRRTPLSEKIYKLLEIQIKHPEQTLLDISRELFDEWTHNYPQEAKLNCFLLYLSLCSCTTISALLETKFARLVEMMRGKILEFEKGSSEFKKRFEYMCSREIISDIFDPRQDILMKVVY